MRDPNRKGTQMDVCIYLTGAVVDILLCIQSISVLIWPFYITIQLLCLLPTSLGRAMADLIQLSSDFFMPLGKKKNQFKGFTIKQCFSAGYNFVLHRNLTSSGLPLIVRSRAGNFWLLVGLGQGCCWVILHRRGPRSRSAGLYSQYPRRQRQVSLRPPWFT